MCDTIKRCLKCKTSEKIYKFITKQEVWCENDVKFMKFRDGFIDYRSLKYQCKNEAYNNDFLNNVCPFCKGNLIETNMTSEEFDVIEKVSNDDRQFLEAMIKLKEDDIIEYQSRMSQFRTQVEQQEAAKKAARQSRSSSSNVPKCPTCGSTNIKRISGLSKAGSVAMWGLFSRKLHKQWRCNSCGSEW